MSKFLLRIGKDVLIIAAITVAALVVIFIFKYIGAH
jgi:hypothetical protein